MLLINKTCHKFSVIKDSGKYRIIKKFNFFVCELFVSHFFRMIFEALIKKCLNILNTVQNNISGVTDTYSVSLTPPNVFMAIAA